MSNNKFIHEFNLIFNKIPHIYSELFLKIFKNNYYYFIDYNNSNNINIFINILEKMFYNLNNINNPEFYYHSFSKYLSNYHIDNNKINKISIKLSNPIEEDYLLNIINNNPNIDNYLYIYKINNNIPDYILNLYVYFLISKTFIKVINILNYYNSINNKNFRIYINKTVEKYRTLELNMSYVLDDYNEKYKNIISKFHFKILIYLLSLSRNGKEIEKKYTKEISKIIDSIGYNTNMHKIIAYRRTSYKIKPYIYKNISLLLNYLFLKHQDDYEFICNKNIILKTCYYLYIKKLSLPDKIITSITYLLWDYEWDSIKKIYYFA